LSIQFPHDIAFFVLLERVIQSGRLASVVAGGGLILAGVAMLGITLVGS